MGWVAIHGVGISPLMLPKGVRFGSVTRPRGDVWACVARRVGRGLRGGGVKRPPNRPPVEGGVGKNSVCSGVREHVACIVGLGI